ncbi:ImmA/IrrE family metallo-endopeptidase [Phenylobacterium sp.]|uniref:ImmA/IrrE family metallo-endopeptidase n=1 Tax=Phenylobacterium sp. TaxID=1871053 RepID=UPI002B860BAE|nr:ImmA/IrrE family metallo-endopeptidase [Phenylobacterium sp.]HVI34075.1 ImmA/IrrE family metallo-endopeptidase [Phenylobacterium sp.]
MSDPLLHRLTADEANIVAQFTQEYPVKVGELAQTLGLRVVTAPLEPRISGLIQPSREAKAGFEIKVNKYETPERQRFTIAHEIAHYLLHRDSIGSGVVDSVLYRSNLTSRKETEANRLAATIVMPASLVAREANRLGGASRPGVAEELARLFRVSGPAMKVRLGLT